MSRFTQFLGIGLVGLNVESGPRACVLHGQQGLGGFVG